MPNELQFDGQYGGLGIPASIADTGDTTLSGTVTSLTATFPQVAGQQPSVARGKLFFEVKNMTTGNVGQIDFYCSDGTRSEWLGSTPAPTTGVAGRGMCFVLEFFCAMASVTNIVSVVAQIGGALTAGTGRLRVLGGP